MQFEKLRSSSKKSAEIVSMIKDKLLDGTLKNGDKLPTETELVEQLGVSRTPVREAIKVLESIGVIQIKRGEGMYITNNPSHFSLNPLIFSLIMHSNRTEKLIEFRQHFEILLINMIRTNGSPEKIKKIEEVYQSQVQRMKPNLSSEELADIDLEFHYAVLEATDNDFVMEIGKTIYELYKPKMIQSKQADTIEWTLHTHRAYLDLLHQKDAVVNEEQINKMIFNNQTWLEERNRIEGSD
ncbi:GntR family transcriptional regulator [Bhargavaea cecembensis]|uniref:GntR family transcriptional regulator n=1 Tax=Bhargavaea cecembensis TaxID=394098 RepID=A0A161SUY9_9BACL|nr:GntR family transcriptional regulator [Bhargavaea cecembensis]KZE39670.1 GntR family transcriptional regulator [Bhargavaea cecembensis]